MEGSMRRCSLGQCPHMLPKILLFGQSWEWYQEAGPSLLYFSPDSALLLSRESRFRWSQSWWAPFPWQLGWANQYL